MNEFKKLKLAREELGLNQTQLAKALSVSQRDISKMEAGEKKFIPKLYIEFLQEQGYDINTLFNDEATLKKINVGAKIAAEAKAEYLTRSDQRQKNQLIPLYSLEATAGLVELFSHFNEYTPLDYLSIPNLPKCDGSIYVRGDSMYPLLKSGDIVVFKKVHDIPFGIIWGEMYIVSIDLEGEEFIAIKYIQKSEHGDKHVKLVSQNEHHQPKDIPINKIRALAMVKASVRINSMH